MIGVDTSEPSIMRDHSFDETIAQFVAEIEGQYRILCNEIGGRVGGIIKHFFNLIQYF